MHVLVTGAAGFIGSNLVDRLLERGNHVIGLDNFDPGYSSAEKRRNLTQALASPLFTLVEGDLNHPPALAATFSRRVDVVVHLAGKAGVRASMEDPLGYVQANVLGTQALLQATGTIGIRAVVFGSSSSVYGEEGRLPFVEDESSLTPISPYAASKRAAEMLCKVHHDAHGGSLICLRLFTVYGPRQRPDLAIRKFATLISEGRPVPVFGDGTTERDYTWIGDTVDGLERAIDRSVAGAEEFEIVNIGTGRATSLARMIELIGEAFGADPGTESLPAQSGDVSRTRADTTKARRLLGFVAKTSLEEGIPRYVDWFRSTYRPNATRVSTMTFKLNASR